MLFFGALVSLLSASLAFGSPVELEERAVNANYLFTAFTSASESNLYVYTSSDATTFSLLKGPAYTPATGLIRDPSVIQHTECVQVLPDCPVD